MFLYKVGDQVELRLIERHHTTQLLELFRSNREHWRPWHPLIDSMQSALYIQQFITACLQRYANDGGFNAGIWSNERLCGIIYHLNLNVLHRSTTLSYWLDESHQGKGIMTACCRAVISHSFNTLRLNRIAIECASQNSRSRRIPERLGFKFEGIVREVEWIYDHYVDHAVYSLLKSDPINT